MPQHNPRRCACTRPKIGSSFLALTLFVLCAAALFGENQQGFASGETNLSGKAIVLLPEPNLTGEVPLERALASRRSVRSFAAKPLPLSSVSQLLWAAQGITHPDGLRTAPSAGALYPLELYLIAGKVSNLDEGVYRYDPVHHRLVTVSTGDLRAKIARAAWGQDWIAEAPAILLISGVYQRTERKYGKRAPRYVHIEVGHAAQNVYLQAVALGLGTTMVGAFDDEALARELDVRAQEKPLALLPIGQPSRRAGGSE